MDGFKLPYAMILGNHDMEGKPAMSIDSGL